MTQAPHRAESALPRTLLVGVANPATTPQLMALAAHVAKLTGCEVVATHVVTVTPQMSLRSARSSPEVAAARDVLSQAIDDGADAGIDVRGVVEVAREIDEGLASAAASQEADILLVGYSDPDGANVEKAEREFDKVMHRVARSVDAGVVVAKFRREEVHDIVLPIASDLHLDLTALLAHAIAAGVGASIRFVHVVGPEGDAEAERPRVESLLSEHGLLDLGELDVVDAEDRTAAIIEQASAHDLAILGATRRPTLAEAIFGSVSERVAAQATSTVLLVRSRPAG